MKNKNRPLLELSNIVVEFNADHGEKIHAVSDISFAIFKGETLGLVGESGCGKSSLARAVMQLPGPASGKVTFCSKDLAQLSKKELLKIRPRFQMVFQDSVSALNPKRSVGKTIAMPLKVTGNLSKNERHTLVEKMMSKVGLDSELFNNKPHQFSGGQCQRIQIARALITEPELLICDEPVSSLDVSIQAQIINLLETMRKQYDLTMLFISHDLAVVKNISDRIAVMYLGKLCEIAPSEQLYQSCAHPYTSALFSAIPRVNHPQAFPKLQRCIGELPSPTAPPSGCRFRTRCPKVKEQCVFEEPKLYEISPGHTVACHLFQ
ncbi:MAG: ATP-binding cassette domain-containing protein [Desulfobacteraceae bacterium]|nr:ATP-binding cassette domain-containing protein [Desulfobacteraceae bacterium]